MAMLVTFGAMAFIQGFSGLPAEISSSPEYATVVTWWILLTLIPIVGAGFGILMPALDRARLAEDRVAELRYEWKSNQGTASR